MTPFDVQKAPLSGRNLIEAAAGTGKTWSIEHLFVRLVLEQGCRVDEILVVTFTEAATDELRDRIRNRLRIVQRELREDPETGSAKADQALADFDRAAIYTIHGFCQRVLREHAFETGSSFTTELIPDPSTLLREVAEDYWRIAIEGVPREAAAHLMDTLKGPPGLLSFLKGIRASAYRVFSGPENVTFSALTEYRKAVDRLRELWKAEGAEALELLADPCLHAGTYGKCDVGAGKSRQEKLYELKEALETALDSEFIGRGLDAAIKNLCADTIASRTKKGKAAPQHDIFIRCQELCAAYRKVQEELECYLRRVKTDFLRYTHAELARRKRERNLQSFDDLLIRLSDALQGSRGNALAAEVRRRFRAVLVDEFQDTDDIQFAIFKNLFAQADGCLFYIGDPKQAIYGFRGADIFAYLRARRSAEKQNTLEGNYRSTPALVKAVNTIFQSAELPFLFEDIEFRPAHSAGDTSGPPPGLVIWHLETKRLRGDGKPIAKGPAELYVARVVASEIIRLTASPENESTLPGDIAVLVRTNDQARLIKSSLARLNVPAVVCSTGSIFDVSEAEEVERILVSLAAPSDTARLKAALATSLLGATAAELDGADPDSGWWAERYERHRAYADQWERGGFIPMFRTLLSREGVKQRLLALPDGERRLTNVLHLAELLHQAVAAENLGPAGLLRWLSRQRGPDTPGRDEHPLRLESDANAVQIVTIHKSKGLEYPVVFCPYPWSPSEAEKGDLLFHDPGADHELTLELSAKDGSPAYDCLDRELLSENLRLLYVALTRAKTRCYLAWGRINKAETSALSYLLHCPEIGSGRGETRFSVQMKERMAGLTDAEIRADLDRLAARSEGTIEVCPLPDNSPSDIRPVVASAREELRCRTFTGTIDRSWRTGSYSFLISGSHDPDAADHDPGLAAPEARAAAVAPDKTRIVDFPAGSRAGSFFHAVLEAVDFRRASHPDTERLIADRLRSFGFDPGWQGAVSRLVAETAEAALFPEDGVTLDRLPPEGRMAEMEFYHPLKTLSPRTLREVFAPFGVGLLQGFPERLGRLTFAPLQGHMKGFIDLVACHGGRFYLMDWKSNRLGADPADYQGERLTAAMQEQLYVLQYHIYTLALHLYLRLRHPAYDYARDFGGVAYVFLRGLDRRRSPDLGIFRDRPDPNLVHALGRALIPDYE